MIGTWNCMSQVGLIVSCKAMWILQIILMFQTVLSKFNQLLQKTVLKSLKLEIDLYLKGMDLIVTGLDMQLKTERAQSSLKMEKHTSI